MKKPFSFLLFLLALSTNIYGQKANYELARKFITPVVFSTDVKPNFLPGSDKFWFVYKTTESVRYYFVDPAAKNIMPLFDNGEFARGITNFTKVRIDENIIEIPYFEFSEDERSFSIYVDKYKLTYDIYEGKFTDCQIITVPQSRRESFRGKPSPDGKYELFARNHNLFVRETATGNEKQLTHDGETFYSFAANSEEKDNESDVPTIARWLDDSRRVVYSRHDSRKNGSMYLLNSYTGRPTVNQYKYMTPGDRFVTQYEPAVMNVETGETVEIDAAKWRDQLLDIIYASPNGEFLYLLRKNRLGNVMEFCKADTRTGKVGVLISERHDPYLNDQLAQFSILNGGRDIIWWSERSGYGHLYHYDGNGKLLNAITEGNWTAGKILRVDTLRREIYFEGYGYDHGINPYYRQLFTAGIDKKGAKLLTPEDANHKVVVTPHSGYLIDNYSRVDTNPVSVLRDKKGNVVVELAKADLSRWFAAGWMLPERFTVKAKDGKTDLYGVMWKPANFDPARKYPVITHVYPGPQSENVLLDFTQTGGYDGPVAQLGFVVVMFGNRGGSPLRGSDYRTFGYGNLRDYAIDDNKYGLEQLAKRYPFIDIDRVGIFGNSGGGMMTFAAMCRYPEFYKAGVSASGNHDNSIFNKWWVETHSGVEQRYMEVMNLTGEVYRDTVFISEPQTNLELAPLLKGHLMLVTGDMDDNVHPAQTMRLAAELMRTAKNFDLVILPGNGHDFEAQGLRFYQYKMWFHFARYLLGDSSADNTVNLARIGIAPN